MDQPLGSRYVLHELLGRGAMGQVFRGTVRGSGAPVAVKVLKPELVSDTEVVARFFRERSILTSIDHPNVAKVLDLVVEGDTLGIVMELVEGQDLRRYLRARGTLPPGEAVWLVGQLLQGLAAVHAGGIVHRDVKPENVLVSTARGPMVLKLTDFGVSRLSYGASLTKMTSLIGTPEYMAPELADHDRATPAADLYSAGIVLYEMLAGRTPFAGGHPLAVLRRQVDQPPPPIPGVPAELWAQIESLLAKDPRSRPASAAAAIDRLAPLQHQLNRMPALPPMPDQPTSGQALPGRESGQTVPGRESGQTGSGRESGQTGSGPATVLRARDRGLAPAAPGLAEPPPILSRPDGRGRSRARHRHRAAVIALPAALVILAAAFGVLLTRSPHASSSASDSQAGPGTAVITAQLGTPRASAVVTVTGSPDLAAGGTQPEVGGQAGNGANNGGANNGGGSSGGNHTASQSSPPQSSPADTQTTVTPTTQAPTTPAPSTTTSSPAVAATPPPPPPASTAPATYAETVGGVTHTWTNYSDAGGTEGASIAAYTTVQIACKVTGFKVADGNTWWYRIASSPWNDAYYASADAFYNNGKTSGSLSGTPFVDPKVPNC